MIRLRVLAGIALAFLVWAGTAYAQVERGTIAGTVRDTSGAVVPDVTITVKNVATGVEFKTASDQGGEYVVPNLIPREYSITATKRGFSTLDRAGIVLHVYGRLEVDGFLDLRQSFRLVEKGCSRYASRCQSRARHRWPQYATCLGHSARVVHGQDGHA